MDVFVTLAKYRTDDEVYEVLHAFFERLLPYTYGERPTDHYDTSGDGNLARQLGPLARLLFVVFGLLALDSSAANEYHFLNSCFTF